MRPAIAAVLGVTQTTLRDFRLKVPPLNEDLCDEQGNRPAKPSGHFQLFGRLHAFWAVNSEGMQNIHKNA
jgi:hypothetical protein